MHSEVDMEIQSLYHRIEALSERASVESGTSYDEYIRLFSSYFEQGVKRKSKSAYRIAAEFGYAPLDQRNGARSIAA